MGTPKKIRAKSIGHYILGKTIGEGTFGKVKLGTHILTGEKVAVKVLEKERIVDVADVERVAREIHILKLIQHPHVIQLYEIIETPRQLYLITEYCSGGELFDHIVANGRVKESEACRFFHQIIAGVEQIHKQNVVHRDLKPENLLLDEHKNIKIVDFGLSNTFTEGQLLKTACGSPCYAAPEMIAGQRYVPARCDVWSCGVILFALVCGYLPFEDQNTATLYRKILNADYQAPKFISDSARELIACMLNTDPEQRFTIPRIRVHAWYHQISEAAQAFDGDRGERVLEEDVLDQLDKFGFPRDYAARCLEMNKHNHVTTTYYLLVEKKRRVSELKMSDAFAGHLPSLDGFAGDLSAGAILNNLPGAGVQKNEQFNEQMNNTPIAPCGDYNNLSVDAEKPGFEAAAMMNTAADADRAGGASPVPVRPGQTSDGNGGTTSPNYGQWAQSLGVPPIQQGAGTAAGAGAQARTVPGDQMIGAPRAETPGRAGAGIVDFRGDAARRGAASAEPPSGAHGHFVNTPNSARTGIPPWRQDQTTPRGSAGTPTVTAPVSTGTAGNPQRKRVPVQQATGFATPRGPVMTPPPGMGSNTPSRSQVHNGASPSSPSGTRSVTPGKRTPGEPQTARAPSRPGTSQGMAAPSKPSGSASARSQNEPRRRQYVGAASESPAPQGGNLSARPNRPASPGTGRNSRAGSVAAQAIVAAADFSGGGGSAGSRTGGPAPAWSGRSAIGGARASSATPEVVTGHARDGVGGTASGAMSAREHRENRGEDQMRTCRGAFNVSCTSSKPPKQIMQEVHRALALQKVAFKQASVFLVKCQRQGMRFEMEISHLDHLESIYVVRFRRVAGDLVSYKELCSKVLAEMKM